MSVTLVETKGAPAGRLKELAYIDVYADPGRYEHELSALSEEVLLEVGETIQEDAWRVWLVQCCIARILLERREGWMRKLAEFWGLSPKRVSEMAAVWRRVVGEFIRANEALPPLPPTFFHEALRAPEPKEALSLAAELKAQGQRISAREFRRRIIAGQVCEEALILSCRNCRYFQELAAIPCKLSFEGETFDLALSIKACRHRGILEVSYFRDLAKEAEACPNFWQNLKADKGRGEI